MGLASSRVEPPPVLEFGRAQVLMGRNGGKFPYGNSILVRGSEESLIIDPSKSLKYHSVDLAGVDRVLLSHCHQDHVAGVHLFPDSLCQTHPLELPAIQGIDGLLDLHGVVDEERAQFSQNVRDYFNYTPRPDATAFEVERELDLGRVKVQFLHTPGHTHGHTCFIVRGEQRRHELIFLADIELTGFGPYYGGPNSSLVDFDRSLTEVRQLDLAWFVTYHHIGVLDQPAFRARAAQYHGMIAQREARLLDYLSEPHTLEEAVAHRIVYRPADTGHHTDRNERNMLRQHLDRLLEQERVIEVAPGCYQRRP